MEISAEVVSAANVDEHCKIVREKYERRQYIARSQTLLEKAYDEETSNEELAREADTAFVSISEAPERKGLASTKEALVGTINLIERAHRGELEGIKTQIPYFNQLTGGFCAPDFMVLAGRPRLGKTALALDWADYIATDQRKSVAVFSLEMTKEQLLQRLICRRQGVDFQLLRTGKLSHTEFWKIAEAAKELKESRLFIDDDPTATPGRILAACKRHKAKYGLDMVIVDNLSLMESDRRTEGRLQEVTILTRQFKKYAKLLGVPILVLVHFSRALENRGEDAIPRLADLRECGTIEQDADVVMGMHKPDPTGKRTDLYILKQRNGPEGIVPLTADMSHMRFLPHDPSQDPF